MHIRQETPADYPVVYTLIKDAFASAEHCDGNEQDLAAALRQSTSFVPELSLVAETDGRIVGHILFTKIRIGTSTQLALAPLSVLPAFQGRAWAPRWSGEATRSPGTLAILTASSWAARPTIPASATSLRSSLASRRRSPCRQRISWPPN